MNNLFRINLSSFSLKQLKEIASSKNLEYECLVNNKKDGFKELWIDIESSTIVAYTTKYNKNIEYTSDFSDKLLGVDKFKIADNKEEPTINDLLDKISLKGLSSLNKKEIKILEKLSSC